MKISIIIYIISFSKFLKQNILVHPNWRLCIIIEVVCQRALYFCFLSLSPINTLQNFFDISRFRNNEYILYIHQQDIKNDKLIIITD